MTRKGEPNNTFFRSARVECVNGQWFFAVREEINMIGPFTSQKEAQAQANDYANNVSKGKLPLSVAPKT